MRTLKTKPFYISSKERETVNSIDAVALLDILNTKYSFNKREGENHKKWFETFFDNFFKIANKTQLERLSTLLSVEAQSYIDLYKKDKRSGFSLLLKDNKSSEIKKYFNYLYLSHVT